MQKDSDARHTPKVPMTSYMRFNIFLIVVGLILVIVTVCLSKERDAETATPNVTDSGSSTDYIVVSELWDQPFNEVTEQPELNEVRVILADPPQSGLNGHVDQPWGLQVVGSKAPLTFATSVCNILPTDQLVELGTLNGGLIVAEFRSDRPQSATGCTTGDTVIARPAWFQGK